MLRILMLAMEFLSFSGAIVIEKFYGNVVSFKCFQNHLYSQ
ncbi:hypothetical protein UF67_1164 [Staphylococcus aureus]|nr:hypothetical protein UF67_1164 [Staphylococcus aureus]